MLLAGLVIHVLPKTKRIDVLTLPTRNKMRFEIQEQTIHPLQQYHTTDQPPTNKTPPTP